MREGTSTVVKLLRPGAGPDAPEVHGEQIHVCERVVISPCAGVFEPVNAPVATGAAGARIEVGTIVGRVSRREVRSPFAGRFVAMLALPGERVRPGQPVAWLRAE
jgi:biotin carboxyl carrier protein